MQREELLLIQMQLLKAQVYADSTQKSVKYEGTESLPSWQKSGHTLQILGTPLLILTHFYQRGRFFFYHTAQEPWKYLRGL